MTETSYRPSNYVVAEPEAIPRADIIKRGDVVDQVGRLIDVYQEQQRHALQAVQTDVTRGGFLSTADQVKERRATSRMYLAFYVVIVAMVSGGLVLLAYGAGYVGAGGAFAAWLSTTGGLSLYLGWRRHGDELKLWPESIARHVVDAHWDLSLFEAETRRLSLQWEYRAEARRQQAQAQAAADARQQAADRMTELQLRRDIQQAQIERNSAIDTYQLSVECQDKPEPTIDTWQRDLLAWVGDLFSAGRLNDNGVILDKVPWSQRSGWADPDGAHARRILCEIRPALVKFDGNRWRWRVDLVDNAEQAVDIVSHRF